MRPPRPIAQPPAGPHLVEVAGTLSVRAGGQDRAEPFGCRMTIPTGTGSVPILCVRNAAAGTVVDLDVEGSLQRDGVLMVTMALRIHHPPEPDADTLDAETTVVPPGAAPAFQLTCLDADGCRVDARGSIAHEPQIRWMP